VIDLSTYSQYFAVSWLWLCNQT